MKEIKIYKGIADNLKVNLREDSEHYSQQFKNGELLEGRIYESKVNEDTDDSTYSFSIEWSDGSRNNYRIKDIILSDSNTKSILIDDTKIYLKQCSEITVEGILDKLYSGNYNSSQATYYKTDNDELYIQCSKNKMRSFDDIYLLCKTYVEDITVEEVFKELLLYKQTTTEYLTFRLRKCSTIERIRYTFSPENRISISNTYITAINEEKLKSLYSWKELFEMINIHNYEDLMKFYKLNLHKNE